MVASCGPAGSAVSVAPPASTPTVVASWQEIEDSPLSPRAQAVGLWTGREVLQIGGLNGELCPPSADCLINGTPLADGAALDPRTGQWRRIADAPVPIAGARAAVVGQTAYLMPHTPDPAAETSLLAYDIDDDQWQWLPVPFDSEDWYELAAAGDQLLAYLVSDEQAHTEDFLFDPATGSWRALPPDPLPDSWGRTMDSTGDELVLLSHELADTETSPPLTLAAAFDPAAGSWRRLPDLDVPLAGPFLAVDGLLVSATVREAAPMGGRLDPANGEWSPLPPPPSGIEHAAGVFTDSSARYFGIRDAVFDVTFDRWVQLPVLPDGGFASHTIVAAGTDLVAFSGVRWQGMEPELSNQTWVWSPPLTTS